VLPSLTIYNGTVRYIDRIVPKISVRKLKIAACVFFIAGSVLAVPASAKTYETPMDKSLYSYTSEESAKALGSEANNTSGFFVSLAKALNRAFSFSEKGESFTDKVQTKKDIASGKITSSEDTSGVPGLGYYLSQATTTILNEKPASAVVFAQQQWDKLTTPTAVYAQEATTDTSTQAYFPGTGWDLLTPIQSFWGWAVGVSYSFMIILIVVVAFAMMFRSKLGGSEVVKIQSAIPGIVMAMVLIPLSYPISGLFIDAITLGTNVIHDWAFSPSGPGYPVYQDIIDNKLADGAVNRGYYADDWRIDAWQVKEFINPTGAIGQVDVAAILNNALGNFAGGLSSLLGELVTLALYIISIFTCLKIIWKLVKSFASLFLFPIVSPFIFATLAIPGQGTKMVMTFIKSLAGFSLHFIVTYGLFVVFVILVSPSFHTTLPEGSLSAYRPPLIPNDVNNVISGVAGAGESVISGTGLVLTLCGLMLFFSIPAILDKINAALQIKAEFPAFLKPALQEIQSSTASAITTASGGYSGLTKATAGALSYKATPFTKSIGEKRMDELKKTVGNISSRAPIFKPLAEKVGDVSGRFLTGKEKQTSGQGKLDYSIALETALGIGTELSATYDDAKVNQRITGMLLLKVADESRLISGKIRINHVNKKPTPPLTIAQLNLPPGTDGPPILIKLVDDGKFVLTPGDFYERVAKESTSGEKETRIPIAIEFPSELLKNGRYVSAPPEFGINVSVPGGPAKFAVITINIRSSAMGGYYGGGMM